MIRVITILSLAGFIMACGPGLRKEKGTKGSYLGQKPPGLIPKIFAPGVVSTAGHEGCACFSPDGKELYFHKGFAGRYAVVIIKQINGWWTTPQVASFSGRYSDAEPHLSHDGRRLVFSSNRPMIGAGNPVANQNIWIVDRQGDDWSEARPFGFGVNTEAKELHPTFSRSNDLYFCSDRDGNLDIFVSRYGLGEYSKPEKLGNTINSRYGDGDAYLSPDESIMVFCSYGRPECLGNADLYVSYRREDGSWTPARNLGAPINTKYREVDPVFSFDGKYLFFRSNRINHPRYSDYPVSYTDILRLENGPGNGNGDIYWVDTEILRKFMGHNDNRIK